MTQPPPAATSAAGLLRRLYVLLPLAVAVSLAFAVWQGGVGRLADLRIAHPPYLILALLLSLVPLLLGAWRLARWLAWLGTPAGRLEALRIGCGAEVGAAISPTAVGGAPVRVLLLRAAGLETGDAVALTTLGTLEDAVFSLLVVPWAVKEAGVEVLAGPLRTVVDTPGWLLLPAGVIVASILLGRLRRNAAGGLPARVVDGVRAWIQGLTSAHRRLLGRGRCVFLGNVGLAMLQWSARYSILTVLLAGLGHPVDPLRTGLGQWLCFAAMTTVPTPGAMGGAELCFAAVHGANLPAGLVGATALLWRLLTYVAPLTAAVVVALAWGAPRRERRETAAPSHPLPPSTRTWWTRSPGRDEADPEDRLRRRVAVGAGIQPTVYPRASIIASAISPCSLARDTGSCLDSLRRPAIIARNSSPARVSASTLRPQTPQRSTASWT